MPQQHSVAGAGHPSLETTTTQEEVLQALLGILAIVQSHAYQKREVDADQDIVDSNQVDLGSVCKHGRNLRKQGSKGLISAARISVLTSGTASRAGIV